VYIGTLKCLTHTHELHLNPFSFKVHEKSTTEYQTLVAQACKYRIGKVSYAESQQLLEQERLGMTISQKTFYNLLRRQPGDSNNPSTIDGLLASLHESDFVYRTRTKDELQGDRVVSRKLVQIVFFLKDAIRFGQRFIAGKVLLVDGTFNTNKLRMPLLVGVGIINSGKTFPQAYSYCPGETAESYEFFFEVLREEVFVDDILDPAVIMGDQAAGLIKAVDVLEAVPNSVLQFCNWHAVEAMRAKFNKAGYTTEELNGWMDGEVEVLGLADLSWAYIKSDTLELLETNRAKLIAALRPKERSYIMEIWLPKEHRVVFCYTKLLNNLGCNATQRSESYHPPLKAVTNGQLSLDDAVAAISNKTHAIYKLLSMDEDRALIDADLALDTKAFKFLINAVSIKAIRLIEEEWIALHELVQKAGTTELDLGPCACQLLLRYSLPCKHHLLQACQTGVPLPKSLVHPRWWLKGPTIRYNQWVPFYGQEQPNTLSPRRRDVYKAVQDVMAVRERLGPEEQARFDFQYLRANAAAKELAERHEELSLIPIGQPDAIPKKIWRKKKTHGKANAPGLTAAQSSDRDRLEAERITNKGKARVTTPEKEVERVPDSPERPSTPLGRKRTHTLVERTPGKLTPTRAPPALQSAPEPSQPAPPPPSTAPAILYKGKGGRERKRTQRWVESKAAGWLAESQPRE
jgi:hypothetical protein